MCCVPTSQCGFNGMYFFSPDATMMRFGVFLISDGVIEIIQSFNGDGRSSPLDFMKLPQKTNASIRDNFI